MSVELLRFVAVIFAMRPGVDHAPRLAAFFATAFTVLAATCAGLTHSGSPQVVVQGWRGDAGRPSSSSTTRRTVVQGWPGILTMGFLAAVAPVHSQQSSANSTQRSAMRIQSSVSRMSVLVRGVGLFGGIFMALKSPRLAGWFGWLRGLQRKGLQVPHKRGPDVLQVGCAVQL